MSEENHFDLSKYEILNTLGSGAFGVVYKVRDNETGLIYAAKKSFRSIDELEYEDESGNIDKFKNITREINIISKLNHPSIVKFIGFSPVDFDGEPYPVIVTEYVSNGSLYDLIKAERQGTPNPKWNSTQKLIVLYGIASAMSYLHSHNIIHRDLKPENILIDDNFFPKVADFGLSKIVHKNEDSITSPPTITYKGTPIYSSPEVLLNYDYTTAGDVYSYAMITYEIITAKKPFGNVTFFQLQNKLDKKERPIIPSSIGASYKKLIKSCWSELKENRSTFDDILTTLRTDRGFITDDVSAIDFEGYANYINEITVSFSNENLLISVNDYLERKRLFESFTKYYYGNGVEVDRAKAAELCKEAADRGSVASMRNYALILEKGDGVRSDMKESIKYFKMAADRGDLTSMKKCAMILLKGVHPDAASAARYCKMAADAGDVEMMQHFAGMLYSGVGVAKDKSSSARYYKMAADGGDVCAMTVYAGMCKDGDGVTQNLSESARYFKLAADNGDASAMNTYAGMLFMGRGVEGNRDLGAHYCRMAAEKGCVAAMHNFAKLLEAGDGVRRDVKLAASFYKKAADSGHTGAMERYAQMLYKGIGVDADKNEAARYHEMAVAHKK